MPEKTKENQWNEGKFRMLIENITDAIVVNDEHYNLLYQSPSVTRILGYDPEDRKGKPVLDYVHPDSKEFFVNLYERINMNPGVPMPFQYQVRHKDGHYVWLEGVVTNLTQDPNVKAYVANYRDITERKENERQVLELNDALELKVKERTAQLEAINRDLESFSYSVSHDLRAPLRAISGYSNILDEDYAPLFDDQGKHLLMTIKKNASRMEMLITDLLSFSKLGRQEVNRTSANINTLVQAVVEELPAHKAEIKVDDLHPAEADEHLMKHVLTNLISNAVKYSSRSPNPAVNISSVREADRIVYSVSDNGAGFDMAFADRLFGVFQRLHKATEFEGTGVGLAIVKRIVERHGGNVWAKSEKEKGATFYFSLPVDFKLAVNS